LAYLLVRGDDPLPIAYLVILKSTDFFSGRGGERSSFAPYAILEQIGYLFERNIDSPLLFT